MAVGEVRFGQATVTNVIEGGQAAQGGVMRNDLVASVNSDFTNYSELLVAIGEMPRPLTISFSRRVRVPAPDAQL